jgi:uncharacterized RDD family membrane protein YckC
MELSPSLVLEVGSNSTASFGLRLAARLLDVLLGGGLAFLGVFLGQRLLHLHATGPGTLAWALVGALLYCVTSEAIGGATLGKVVLRLRVTAEDLTPCSFKGALLRTLALGLDAFGFTAWRAMSRSLMSQRYGDQWAHTLVLHVHSVPPDSRRGVGRVVLGLLSGSALWVLCVALSVATQAL